MYTIFTVKWYKHYSLTKHVIMLYHTLSIMSFVYLSPSFQININYYILPTSLLHGILMVTPNTFAVIKACDGIMSNLNSLSFHYSEYSRVSHNSKKPYNDQLMNDQLTTYT